MRLMRKFTDIFKIKKKTITVLVIGLNKSGKSTIISSLKYSNSQNLITIPTIGFSIEEFPVEGAVLSVIDMSGLLNYRNLWEHNLKNCQGIIYVIDSSDKMRLVVAKEELVQLINHNDLKNRCIPILLVCNKIDLHNAITSIKIASVLELSKVETMPWHIISTNAITGEGLTEGVQWLVQHIKGVV